MIRVGLLGSGFMGKTHAQAWRQLENAKVVVVAGLPLDSAAEVAASVHSEVTTSLDEVISNKRLQPSISHVSLKQPI
jgi:predicted dehydrogenase